MYPVPAGRHPPTPRPCRPFVPGAGGGSRHRDHDVLPASVGHMLIGGGRRRLERVVRRREGNVLMPGGKRSRDTPWMRRPYSGHSTATASNALYRTNLAKGQTGLSIAFDLPTQTGYDPDSPLARGEVGKVGVPIQHLGEMRRLFDGIPLTEMNTSMTINATAMWLLALYQVAAEEQNPGVDPIEVAHRLAGTTQNDIIKEDLSRGTYVFPPEHS